MDSASVEAMFLSIPNGVLATCGNSSNGNISIRWEGRVAGYDPKQTIFPRSFKGYKNSFDRSFQFRHP